MSKRLKPADALQVATELLNGALSIIVRNSGAATVSGSVRVDDAVAFTKGAAPALGDRLKTILSEPLLADSVVPSGVLQQSEQAVLRLLQTLGNRRPILAKVLQIAPNATSKMALDKDTVCYFAMLMYVHSAVIIKHNNDYYIIHSSDAAPASMQARIQLPDGCKWKEIRFRKTSNTFQDGDCYWWALAVLLQLHRHGVDKTIDMINRNSLFPDDWAPDYQLLHAAIMHTTSANQVYCAPTTPQLLGDLLTVDIQSNKTIAFIVGWMIRASVAWDGSDVALSSPIGQIDPHLVQSPRTAAPSVVFDALIAEAEPLGVVIPGNVVAWARNQLGNTAEVCIMQHAFTDTTTATGSAR